MEDGHAFFSLTQAACKHCYNPSLRWKLTYSLTTSSLSSWKRESDWLSMSQVSMVGLVTKAVGSPTLGGPCEMLGGTFSRGKGFLVT